MKNAIWDGLTEYSVDYEGGTRRIDFGNGILTTRRNDNFIDMKIKTHAGEFELHAQ